MQKVLLLLMVIGCFLSCRTNTEKIAAADTIQLLIPDTTNNQRAQWDLRTIQHCSQIEKQLGLKDLQQGADSFEIRYWYDFSFSNFEELFILKYLDTTYLLSYYRVYLRHINYDDENRDRKWDPFTQAIIDSSVSKNVLLTKGDCKGLELNKIWDLKSQSELGISDNIGFTDCDSYIIEVADKKHYKFFRHHCAGSYYEKIKLPEIKDFIDYYDNLRAFANMHNVIVPFSFNY